MHTNVVQILSRTEPQASACANVEVPWVLRNTSCYWVSLFVIRRSERACKAGILVDPYKKRHPADMSTRRALEYQGQVVVGRSGFPDHARVDIPHAENALTYTRSR